MDEMIEIAGAEDLPGFSPPQQPTEAIVRVQRDDNGDHKITTGDYKSDKMKGKKWIRIPFVVVGGEFNNRWATLFLALDGTDSRFRKAFQVVTAIEGDTMKSGTKMSIEDFKTKLAEGTFLAIIEQETKWDAVKKEKVPTEYTAVSRLIRKVEEDEVAAPAASDDDGDIFGVGGGADVDAAATADDDDMPF